MKSLTTYILCHNRPDYAKQAIQSVLNQTQLNFTLVISDNSSNNEVEQMVKREFSNVNYIRRTPMLRPLEHFNRCISEAGSEYFCLFHDDDVMRPNYVDAMMQCAKDHENAIAIGCNANTEKFGKLETRTSFHSIRKVELIDTPLDLAHRYFARAQSGFAPFPSYIYNRRLVGETRLPAEGGKYADVTWLLSLAKKCPIVWVNEPLMTYRLHGGNDGNVESMRDRLRFLGYLKQNINQFSLGLLQDYRCSFIYKKVLKAQTNTHPIRMRIAKAFLKNYRWSRYVRLDTYRALVARVLVKWMAE